MHRIVIGLLLALSAAPAWADSIDGAWCHLQGRRMVINGPNIITPTGARAQGDYGRHDFSYVAPPGDPAAGTTIRMVLMGELHVRVREGEAEAVVWDRCGPSISFRRAAGLLG